MSDDEPFSFQSIQIFFTTLYQYDLLREREREMMLGCVLFNYTHMHLTLYLSAVKNVMDR